MCNIMMVIRQSYLWLLISGGLVISPCINHAEEYYRWKDANGNVQYSFTRPAGADYTVLDQAGRHLSTTTAKTPTAHNESAANAAHQPNPTIAEATADNANQANNKVDNKAAQKAQEPANPLSELSTYDKFLLASYLDLTELAQDHEKKTKRLAVQIENYKKNRQKLYDKIEETELMLASATQAAAKEKLQAYLENTQNIVHVYTQNITKNEQKMVTQKAQYLTDKLRLKALLALKNSATSSHK